MQKLTRKTLHELRDRLAGDIIIRKPNNKQAYIIVGMGESGIEKGAKEIFNLISNKIDSCGLRGKVIVIQSAVEEMDSFSPFVEVILDGCEPVKYGYVTAELAEKIVEQHIIHKQVLSDYVLKTAEV